MKSFFVCIAFLLSLDIVISEDSCSSSFSAFLQCMADDSDKKINRYMKEVSPEVKKAVQDCFVKNGCEKPDLTNSTLDDILHEPWLTRARDIFDLLENMDAKVKDCMMRYFLDLVRKKINDCIKETGAEDVKDFEMPPLPDVHNVDITKIKEIVLNRLTIRNAIVKCNQTKGPDAENNTIYCILDARKQYDDSLCETRINCKRNNITESKCQARFEKIHNAVCECATAKGSVSKNTQQLFLTGKLEKEYKKCHDDNGVAYPIDRVKKFHDAIKAAVQDFLSKRPIPQEVGQILALANQAMADVEGQWKGAFCAECSDKANSTSAVDLEVQNLQG